VRRLRHLRDCARPDRFPSSEPPSEGCRTGRRGHTATVLGVDNAARPDMNVGFNKLVGMELLDFGPDGGAARLRIDQRHHQPYGIVHGGVYAALIETVASISGSTWLRSRQGTGRCVGVNNNTDFLRAISDGVVTATSTPIHRGRRQQLWLVEVVDETGRMVARGQVRLQNLDS